MAMISGAGYEPDSELRSLLDDVAPEVTIEYDAEHEISLGDTGVDAVQRDYTVAAEGFELDGTETQSPLGIMVSLDGHLGLAATTQLVNALQYGQITLLYMDESPPRDAWGDRYEDTTAEWYYPRAVELGLPEKRMATRPDRFETDALDVGDLEQWARAWLSLDSTAEE